MMVQGDFSNAGTVDVCQLGPLKQVAHKIVGDSELPVAAPFQQGMAR